MTHFEEGGALASPRVRHGSCHVPETDLTDSGGPSAVEESERLEAPVSLGEPRAEGVPVLPDALVQPSVAAQGNAMTGLFGRGLLFVCVALGRV